MWQDGTIKSDSGETLATPGMVTAQLVAAKVDLKVEIEGTNVHRTAHIGPIRITGHECHLVEHFQNNRLEKVIISLYLPYATQLGFGNRALDPQAEVTGLDNWVFQETGKKSPATYVWGDIRATYDQRGGFAGIIFRFGTR